MEGKLKALQETMHGINDSIKEYAVQAQKNSELSAEAKLKIDEALIAQSELNTRMLAMEQAQNRLDSSHVSAAEKKTLGEIFAAAEEIKNYRGGGKASVMINAQSVTDAVTRTIEDGDSIVNPQYKDGIIALPDRNLTVRSLLNWGKTEANSYVYAKETGFTNNAAGVVENPSDPKPQSKLSFKLETANSVTIAHWIPASRQLLRDSGQVARFIDHRLRYGLDLAEELQLLFGAGGADVNGIYTQAQSYSQPTGSHVTDENAIDRLRLAILQSELAELPVDGIVLSKVDWTNIELLKTDFGYLFGGVGQHVGHTLWGRSVVATNSMTTGKFLTGAFGLGVDAFDLENTVISVSDSHDDYFTKNMVAIRAEKDILVAVTRPEAFVKGDLPAIS